MQTQMMARVEAVAESLSGNVVFQAFPFELLIGTIAELVRAIINGPCFQPKDGVEAQRFVAQRFSERRLAGRPSSGGYANGILNTTRRQAAKAAREKHGQDLTYTQAHQMAVETLDAIRKGDTVAMSSIIDEVRGVATGDADTTPQPLIIDAEE